MPQPASPNKLHPVVARGFRVISAPVKAFY